MENQLWPGIWVEETETLEHGFCERTKALNQKGDTEF